MEATASNGLDGLEATVSDTWLTIFSEVENQASGTAQHNQIMGGAWGERAFLFVEYEHGIPFLMLFVL